MSNKSDVLRNLPSVDKCLNSEHMVLFLKKLPRPLIIDTIRSLQKEIRLKVLSDDEPIANDIDESYFYTRLKERLVEYEHGFLKKVINATGIIVHTNLGRSIFSKEVALLVAEKISSYNNLEYNVNEGKRSSRYEHLVTPLRLLTLYDDFLIVNNNAAAVFLLLDTFAKGKEVIVSRSELVEIGGGFRIPDVMKKAGVTLVEVGCTNKTYLEDYEEAITDNTAMIIKVHRSNFHISGFTSEPSITQLQELADNKRILFMYDLGSGNLLPHDLSSKLNEPSVVEIKKEGAQIVCFSGDKLLGGPQAGIILSDHQIITNLKKNQLLRALRVDKMCIAALEATLNIYLYGNNEVSESIPTVSMLNIPKDSIRQRSLSFIESAKKTMPTIGLVITEGYSQIGGGSLPHEQIPTVLLALDSNKYSPAELDNRLRCQFPPVIARISNDTVLIDLRTVAESDEEQLLLCIKTACQ